MRAPKHASTQACLSLSLLMVAQRSHKRLCPVVLKASLQPPGPMLGPRAHTRRTLSDLLVDRPCPQKPNSQSDFSFRIVTSVTSLRVDPGSKAAFDKWQEALMAAVSTL